MEIQIIQQDIKYQKFVKARTHMNNRSILKTRNELERITYKINQLKNKYTAENAPSVPKQSPLRQHSKFNHQRQESVVRSHRGSRHEGEQDTHHLQLKAFKKEIYHYIDKCMLLNSKEPKAEKQTKSNGGTEQRIKKIEEQIKNRMQNRMKKIEEELSDCITTNAQILKEVRCEKFTQRENEKLDELSDNFDLLLGKIEQFGHESSKCEELEKRIIQLEEVQRHYESKSEQNWSQKQEMKKQQQKVNEEMMNQMEEINCTLESTINKLQESLVQELNLKVNFQISNLKDLLLQEVQNRNKAVIELTQQMQARQTPENQNSRLLENIDSKLDQFQKDINEAIKELYDDIQLRLLQHQKTPTESMKEIKQQVVQNDDGIKKQIFQEMSMQIEKVSCVLEKTIEEIQMKMEKLDHNFSYVYERMSNIEYDNVNFKDKLSSFMKGDQSQQSRKSNILDTLGNLGSPTFFSQLS